MLLGRTESPVRSIPMLRRQRLVVVLALLMATSSMEVMTGSSALVDVDAVALTVGSRTLAFSQPCQPLAGTLMLSGPVSDYPTLREEPSFASEIVNVTCLRCVGLDDDRVGRVRPLPHHEVMTVRLDVVALKQECIDVGNGSCSRTQRLCGWSVRWCGSKYGIATLVERQDLVGASRSLEHIDRRRRDVRCMTRAWSIPPALDIGRLHQAWFRRPRMGSVAVRSC